MSSIRNGSVHLFCLAGVDLFLHWSWFLVAVIEIEARNGRYSSVFWSVLEYLSLFLIVLLHEFGHALACRQVGGEANRIMLWPLGGVAYVNPPQRPGATLWSIAAGPLVNVVLLLPLLAAFWYARSLGWAHLAPDAYRLMQAILAIDIGLLAFNILPIYPLDGGQILRSLLWYPLGRARSLMVVTVLGLLGIAGFIVLAIWSRSMMFGAVSVFLLLSCWGGLRQAQALWKQEKLPRRTGFRCPSCHTAPPLGAYWQCAHCQQIFDTFETGAVCPGCGAQYGRTMCLDCQKQYPVSEWGVGVPLGLAEKSDLSN